MICVPLWVIRSLYGSSERLCAHESSESLQGCPFMGHQICECYWMYHV
ncbi:hypothetical protein LOK49_LG10G00930 [Camellia lanceoleosa]|uniref:Uncharacterized protein n=1 Tax=Camellia lanceoleosa TaxID=1840588 RepID=A0ACC0G8K4_9ERIC|nr:hypothetical protein LOK49_LG10G00930 [Camellia lanceoleosa]